MHGEWTRHDERQSFCIIRVVRNPYVRNTTKKLIQLFICFTFYYRWFSIHFQLAQDIDWTSRTRVLCTNRIYHNYQNQVIHLMNWYSNLTTHIPLLVNFSSLSLSLNNAYRADRSRFEWTRNVISFQLQFKSPILGSFLIPEMLLIADISFFSEFNRKMHNNINWSQPFPCSVSNARIGFFTWFRAFFRDPETAHHSAALTIYTTII